MQWILLRISGTGGCRGKIKKIPLAIQNKCSYNDNTVQQYRRELRHNGVSAEISLYKNWTKGKKLCYNAS